MQPRSQGFSLLRGDGQEKEKGKSPGNEVEQSADLAVNYKT